MKFKISPHHAVNLEYQLLRSSRHGHDADVYDLRADGPAVSYTLSF